ncbi:hypothetical protein MMIC_P2326 [Mariprofundus micogutta]|uniref:Uncharacterized protein n=1 Tax=Mariprofundus micogutta TaxID=1921010 RepID=A0A1L8CQZ9_9PROT|nr:hypothetical protein [Mariprofundus micogutta]GAV21342.1 hypothetical protein MMIC_P2326 [Mariprofundus micogutta]
MDIALIAGIFLTSAGILALLILFMTFEPDYLKKLAIGAVALFVLPLLIALVGNSMGWFDVYTIEIVTLRQGALSVFIAAAYGVMVGVLLNSIKIYLINLWRGMRSSKQKPEE